MADLDDILKLMQQEKNKQNKVYDHDTELANARATGTRIENVVCPCCCLNRVLHKKSKGTSRFDDYDFDRPFIQVRYSSPSHGGFFMDRDESISFRAAKDMPEYKDLMDQIRTKCRDILNEIGE